MPSLLDIGPLSASVTLRGVPIEVQGVGSDALVLLLDQFPALYKAMSAAQSGAGLNPADFIKMGPDIVAAIVTTAAGMGGNADAVAKVKSLTIGEQAEVLEPILKMTFPRGFVSFVEALTRIAEGAGGQSGKAPVTK